MIVGVLVGADGDELTLQLIKGHKGHYVDIRVWDDYQGRGANTILYRDSVDFLIQALTDLRKEMN